MNLVLSSLQTFWRIASSKFSLRRGKEPISTTATLFEFVSTRSAFIAQKMLFGYVKTRMGTSYPKMFEDDIFVQSINIAKMHVFAACLSDLTIFAIAHALPGDDVTDAGRADAARACYETALTSNLDASVTSFDPAEHISAFSQRLDGTDWPRGARHRHNFSRSPLALVKWAPIAPELKKFDTEIVENSIKFAWRNIRTELIDRLEKDAVCGDWHKTDSPGA